MDYFLLDLDSTIAKAGERNIFFLTEPKNYRAAGAGVIHDEIIPETKQLIDFFYSSYNAGYEIVVLTARAESCRKNTESWLEMHDIHPIDIFMRANGNYDKDYVEKERLLDLAIEKYGMPKFALDDKLDVIEMYNRRGIFVFGVHNRN